MDNLTERTIESQRKITDGIISVFPFVCVSINLEGPRFFGIRARWWYRNRECNYMKRVELDMLDSVLEPEVVTDIIVEDFIMNISKRIQKIEKEAIEYLQNKEEN